MGYKQYYVYLLTNEWRNVIYTGVTNSLERRVWEHKHGTTPGFTKKYNCHLLVYFEIFDEIEQANRAREADQRLDTEEEKRPRRDDESEVA